jgi:hypothetical protein
MWKTFGMLKPSFSLHGRMKCVISGSFEQGTTTSACKAGPKNARRTLLPPAAESAKSALMNLTQNPS